MAGGNDNTGGKAETGERVRSFGKSSRESRKLGSPERFVSEIWRAIQLFVLLASKKQIGNLVIEARLPHS